MCRSIGDAVHRGQNFRTWATSMILVHLRLCPQVSVPTSTTHMHRDEQQHSVEEDLQPHRIASEGRKSSSDFSSGLYELAVIRYSHTSHSLHHDFDVSGCILALRDGINKPRRLRRHHPGTKRLVICSPYYSKIDSSSDGLWSLSQSIHVTENDMQTSSTKLVDM